MWNRVVKKFNVAGAVTLAIILAVANASAEGVLYGAAHSGQGGPSALYRIDPLTGAAEFVGPIMIGEGDGAFQARQVTGMDADPAGRLYATGVNGEGKYVLLVVDAVTGVAREVGHLGIESIVIPGVTLRTITDISFSSGGTLYGNFVQPEVFPVKDRVEYLGMINPLTGTASVLGPTVVSEGGAAIAFFEDDVLFKAGLNLDVLNVATGEAVNEGSGETTALVFLTLQGGNARINTMDVNPDTGVGFAGVNAGFSGGGPNYLATVNTESREVSLIGETVKGLAALAFVPVITDAQPPPLAGLDQYECKVIARGRYKKSSDAYTLRVKSLQGEWESKKVRVLNPVSLCTPIADEGKPLADPRRSLTCYRFKEIETRRNATDHRHLRFEWRNVEVENEFGVQIFSVVDNGTLCVSSEVISDEVKIRTWDHKNDHYHDKQGDDHKQHKDKGKDTKDKDKKDRR